MSDSLPGARDRTLAPRFESLGTEVLRNPLGATPVPVAELGPAVASLADDDASNAVMGAIDRAITRAYG